jgi:eukaryotic-like serine/threonine-protein kinase
MRKVMEATESVLRAGYKLDRYELLCPIASGGMATVWLARLRGKRGFEKLFAIKTIRTELVDDPRFQEMFLDEARIASAVQHANVAQILDLGEQDDVLFIVMEWVDGDSLAKIRRLLAKREAKLPVGVVLRVLAEASAGLHAAHELRDDRGEPLEIVHRDVSPHNILLSASGGVKVIDFGIAKAQNRRQGQTRTGIVKGKIQYMAPEQVKSAGTVDRRADVWALGMCLHELVMGQLPYDGDDDVGVIRRLMSDEAPAISAHVPPAIARVLERSIVLDPDARFPTAAAMQRALEGAMKELGESASSEDIAALVRLELPDLGRNRREAVARALEEARERGTPVTDSRDEVAFAPTEVGHRDARARGIALTRRKGAAAAEPNGSENSRLTPPAALEQEAFALPKQGRPWLWGMLLLAAVGTGAALLWPATTSRVLSTLGWGGSRPQAVEETASGGRALPPAEGESVRPVVSAGASARVTPPDPIGAPSAAADVHPPDAAQPRSAPVRAAVPPSATASEEPYAPVPLSASAVPPPAPAASEEDPNNPYNDNLNESDVPGHGKP